MAPHSKLRGATREGAGAPAGSVDEGDGGEPGEELAGGGDGEPPEGDPGGASPPGAGASEVVYSRERFDEIYEEESAFAWGILRRRIAKHDLSPESAEDVHQQAFLTMDEVLHAKGTLTNPQAMLVRIIGHQLCNRSRDRANDQQVMVPDDADGSLMKSAISEEEDGEDRASQTDYAEMVETIFDQMPRDQAKAMRLIDLEGMNHAQAGDVMNRKEGTVRKLHYRARNTFREVGRRLFGEIVEDFCE
jgi:RNA polymerase sigma factor (sigma-70 family)